MSTVLIPGGTGMIGQAISKYLLQQGNQVIVFSRSPEKQTGKDAIQFAHWDPQKAEYDPAAIRKADHLILLAGAGIADKRWTEKRKNLIRESRVGGAHLILRALRETPNNIRSVVSASAIGWYGPDPDDLSAGFTESDPHHNDFLGETCKMWEDSIYPVTEMGKKLVILRTGIVLSSRGGALQRFLQPLKFGIVPVLGSGKQVISWIHIEDLVRMYVNALEDPAIQGVYNAVSPMPVSNKRFMDVLRQVTGCRGLKMKVPGPLLRAVLGEVSGEVLKSATVSSQKIIETGFNFKFPELQEALRNTMEHG